MVRALLAAVAVALAAAPVAAQDKAAKKAAKRGEAIAHMVYFKLKDPTPENKAKLVAACQKYLVDHEGLLFFAAGTRAEEFKREVNDQDYDVALQMVFANKAAHDKYADHPEHLKFIEENKELWAKVRVFDSQVTPTRVGKKKDAAK